MLKSKAEKNTQERGSTGLALKAGFWYVASTFLLKSIAFITVPIFSRLLSKGDYGEFSNYANWQSTLLIITGAELYSSLSRAYYDYKEDYDKYVSSVTVLSILITAAVYLFFLVNSSWIFTIVKIPPQYVHIMFFTLMCSACKALFMTRERTLYSYKSVAFISAMDTVIPTAISVLLVVCAAESDRLSARIYGFYLPSTLIGLGCTLFLLAKGRSFKLEHCSYALKLSIPLLFHYFTTNLLATSNTIIAKNYGGSELTAEVSMATSVIHIQTILFQALSGAVTTWLMDNLEQKQYDKLKKQSFVYLVGLAVLSLGVIFVAPEVLMILGGAQYASSVSLIPGLVLATYIQAAATIFTIILTFDKNVVKTAGFTSIAAVISVGAKVLLFPVMGVQCLPLVNVIICAGLFAVNYILVVKAGYGKTIALGGYILLIAVVGVVVLLSPMLYTYNVVRYAIIGVAAIVFVCLLAVFWKKFRKK